MINYFFYHFDTNLRKLKFETDLFERIQDLFLD
jgi:hypothetical protein